MKIIHAQGKRKAAIARATLSPGKGKISINGLLMNNYPNELLRLRMLEPMVLAGEMAKTVDINIKVAGGGSNGQADATPLWPLELRCQHIYALDCSRCLSCSDLDCL